MRLSSRFLPPSLAALALAAAIVAPGAARAEGIISVSPGFTLSISFGDKTAFGMGVDVRMTTLLKGEYKGNYCADTRIGLGPFAQVTWLNFSAWRVATGVHGGGEIVQGKYGVDGELGWTYRTSFGREHPGGHGIHLGILNALFPAEELSVRGTISWLGPLVVPEGAVGIGPRYPGPFGLPGRRSYGCSNGVILI
jgi:hypothetical protein